MVVPVLQRLESERVLLCSSYTSVPNALCSRSRLRLSRGFVLLATLLEVVSEVVRGLYFRKAPPTGDFRYTRGPTARAALKDYLVYARGENT